MLPSFISLFRFFHHILVNSLLHSLIVFFLYSMPSLFFFFQFLSNSFTSTINHKSYLTSRTGLSYFLCCSHLSSHILSCFLCCSHLLPGLLSLTSQTTLSYFPGIVSPSLYINSLLSFFSFNFSLSLSLSLSPSLPLSLSPSVSILLHKHKYRNISQSLCPCQSVSEEIYCTPHHGQRSD